MHTSFALLDDAQACQDHPSTRLYTNLTGILTCECARQFPSFIYQLEQALKKGWYAVAVLTYECGVALHHQENRMDRAKQKEDISYILLYERCEHLSKAAIDQWLDSHFPTQNTVSGIAHLTSNIDEKRFCAIIKRIQDYIKQGDTYQVNYTYRIKFDAYGEVAHLYQRLRQAQTVPFGAFITLPDNTVILSCSPELFLRHEKGQLITSPMKGTMAADDTSRVCHEQLASHDKNRAENIMIVDLLRNDLGRIAQTGSVKVCDLFRVEQFNHVLQMTSTITALCRDNVQLIDILYALYPCGSITGAPKLRTMEIINQLESTPRGYYTGAIGWFDPLEAPSPSLYTLPNFCLSVAIRTIHLHPPLANGIRPGVMGVGAGIVFDSIPKEEYQECQLKTRFLTQLPAQFSLIETMYITKEGCRHWGAHLTRLTKSATYFGIPLDILAIKKRIDEICAIQPQHTPIRLRLSLDGVGTPHFEEAPIILIEKPIDAILSPVTQTSTSLWLKHKTTVRAVYNQAIQEAQQCGAFDMLFLNEKGMLTEGARTNVLVHIENQWYTPTLDAGLLPGVMRSVLLRDPNWNIVEKNISIDMLQQANHLCLCNAIIGVLPVKTLRLSHVNTQLTFNTEIPLP